MTTATHNAENLAHLVGRRRKLIAAANASRALAELTGSDPDSACAAFQIQLDEIEDAIIKTPCKTIATAAAKVRVLSDDIEAGMFSLDDAAPALRQVAAFLETLI